MARCFPEIFPIHKAKDPKFRAEGVVYAALSEQLSDAYTVFYSASWQGAGKQGHKRDCEIDFLVAHPEKGILVLEIKGGGISYDANRDEFKSHGSGGAVYTIKNPYDQAQTNKYFLLNRLKERQDWLNRKVAFGHGVIFPDAKKPKSGQGLSFPEELTIYVDDLGSIQKRIENIYLYWAERDAEGLEKLGRDGVERLKSLFATSYSARVPMVVGLQADEKRILELTEQQFAILDFLSFQRRALIQGGAGTGKTVLALEKARKLARDGFRTMLLCFNKPLSKHLQNEVSGLENLDADTFHGFCLGFAYQTGLLRKGILPKDSAFFTDALPEIMLQALDKTELRYDAIIVDEGQDFANNWWEPLQYALSDPDDGILYIFYDESQRVQSGGKSEFPIQSPPFVLTQNLRNTKAIFEAAKRYCPEGLSVSAEGPDGRTVENISNPVRNQKDLSENLSKVLHRLVIDEAIPIADIVILTGKDQKSSLLNGLEKVGNFRISFGEYKKGFVFSETARRFKGLERSVVILVEYAEFSENKELMYVAMTRARSHLVTVR